MERVLPSPEVKERVAALAVGLAADCDAPENAVEQILRANLPGAGTLPFAGFLTHDGKWIGGFSGFKDAAAFLKVVESTEQSPHLRASKAVQKKLAALAATAGKAAERGDWKSVVKASRDAAKTTGRCPERDTLAGLAKKAREWAAAQFEAATKLAQSGGDLDEARKLVGDVKKHFAGEPEGVEADAGLKALARLSQVVAAEAGASPPSAAVREKAAKEYRDTRWAAIFEKGNAPAEPAEEPGDGGEEGE